MAGLFLAASVIPLPYIATNVASYVEGKGLRPIGGILDTVMVLGATVVGNNVLWKFIEVDYSKPRRDKSKEESDQEYRIGATVGGATIIGLYVGGKYLIGSPTSMWSNALVAASFPGAIAVIFNLGDKILKFH